MKKVNSLVTCAWVNSVKINLFSVRESLKIIQCFLVGHETLVLFVWSSNYLEDNVELVVCRERESMPLLSVRFVWRKWETGLSWEEWLSVKVSRGTLLHHTKELGEDATN